MREDINRLQVKLQKRKEREAKAEEQIQLESEMRVYKATLFNEKGQQVLEKVKQKQRSLELQSIRSYHKNMQEIEERRKNALESENKKAKQGQRDFLERERAAQRRNTEDQKAANEEIVSKLFSLEVKLNKSQ